MVIRTSGIPIQWITLLCPLSLQGIHDCGLFKIPDEQVEYMMAPSLKVNDVSLKVTNNVTPNVYMPLYTNVTDLQPSDPTDGDFGSSPLLENPTYNRLVVSGTAVDDAPPATTVDIEGYKPQELRTSPLLASCVDSSYQALEDVCRRGPPQMTWNTHLESDNNIPVGLVGDPISVNSSQRLLGNPWRHGHMEQRA